MNRIPRFFAPAALGFLLVAAPGCYTQVATMDDEPFADESSEPYLDSDTSVAVSSPSVDFERPITVPWWEFDYYYPGWHRPVVIYDPWPYWDLTIAYPYPWWCDWPGYGYWSYRPWYWGSTYAWGHAYHDYGPYYGTNGSTVTTRNSGVRRSGNERRRDYDGARSSAGSTSARPATVQSGSGGRATARGTSATSVRTGSGTRTGQPASGGRTATSISW